MSLANNCLLSKLVTSDVLDSEKQYVDSLDSAMLPVTL